MQQQQTNVNSAPAPVGWGIIGSADGYQYSVQGAVEQQLKCAQYWDLPTKIAVVLPTPDSKERIPLYCVAFRKVNNVNIIAVIQYLSTRQQGSYRSGTFFGSFVEMANNIPTIETAEILISALTKMSGFQFQNFIDAEKNSYKQNIKNQPFTSPSDELQQIVSQLKPLTNLPIDGKKNLFVNCIEGNRDSHLLSLILDNPYLSRYFENIYFSSSPTICEKFKSVPDVEYQYVNTFKSYLDLLNSQLTDQEIKARYFQAEQGKLLNTLKGLQEENNSYKQSLENFKISIQNEINQHFKLEKEQFMQQQNQIISDKDNKIKQLEEQNSFLTEEKAKHSQKSALFDGVVQYISQNIDFGNEQQQQMRTLQKDLHNLSLNLQQKQQIITDLENEKRQLSHYLKEERNKIQPVDPELLDSIKTYKISSVLFGLLFVISLIGLVALYIWGDFGNNVPVQQTTTTTKTEQELKDKNGKLENKNRELEGENKKLAGEFQMLKENIKAQCVSKAIKGELCKEPK